MSPARDIVRTHARTSDRVRMLEITSRDDIFVPADQWTPGDTRTNLLANLILSLGMYTIPQSEDFYSVLVSGPARMIREAMWGASEWHVTPTFASYEQLSTDIITDAQSDLAVMLAYEFTRLLMAVGAFQPHVYNVGSGQDVVMLQGPAPAYTRYGGTGAGPIGDIDRIVEWESIADWKLPHPAGDWRLFPVDPIQSPGPNFPAFGVGAYWNHVGGGKSVEGFSVAQSPDPWIPGNYVPTHYTQETTATYNAGTNDTPQWMACYNSPPDIDPDELEDLILPEMIGAPLADGITPDYNVRATVEEVACPNNPGGPSEAGGHVYVVRARHHEALYFRRPPLPYTGETVFNQIRSDWGGVQGAPSIEALENAIEWAFTPRPGANSRPPDTSFPYWFDGVEYPMIQWFIDQWGTWLDGYLRLSAEHGGWEPLRLHKDYMGNVEVRAENGLLHFRGSISSHVPTPRAEYTHTQRIEGPIGALPEEIDVYGSGGHPYDQHMTAYWSNGQPADIRIYRTVDGTGIYVANGQLNVATNLLVFDGASIPIESP